MKINIESDDLGFDTLLQPTDWRYSSAIVGLVLYLERFNHEFMYLRNSDVVPENRVIGFDGVMYNHSDVKEEEFLQFVEEQFPQEMTHCKILSIIQREEINDEDISLVNSLLKSKTIFKKTVGSVKFDGSNKEHFITSINENRQIIIREIFRNGKSLYTNFCNSNLLFTNENPHCRLVGYNVDEGRKTKFLGFGFSKDSFVGCDIPEFDFIPFAFTTTYESYFINNNFNIEVLIKTKQQLDENLEKLRNDSKSSRKMLMQVLRDSEDFVNYDVEIITKSRDKEYYSTLFVRHKNLKALKDTSIYNLSFTKKITDEYYFNLEEIVYDRCLNGVLLDDIVEYMLKIYFDDGVPKGLIRNRTDILININEKWKGEVPMENIESAKNMGFKVSQKLMKKEKANKINSYKQRIVGALVAHDYDRVNEVILSLSAYVEMEFSFAYQLFEDPEKNKGLAMAFASALNDNTKNNTENKKEN